MSAFLADGKISPEEFVRAYAKTGMSVEGSLYIFFRLDGNGDNEISAEESAANFDKLDLDGKRRLNVFNKGSRKDDDGVNTSRNIWKTMYGFLNFIFSSVML